MRNFLVLTASIFLAVAFFGRGEVTAAEKPSAIDGSTYTVIAPVYDGSGGSVSFIRLYNSDASNASTFNILIVNTNNGITLGSVAIQVPPNASPQYPLTLAGGSNSIFAQAGVAVSAGANYALYLQNSSKFAGYQHVTFNGATTLFLNASACSTALNQHLADSNRQVLPNLHTSTLSSYPSSVTVHNYAATSTAVTLELSDAATGTSLGQTSQTIAANGTLSLTNSQIENLVGYTPTSSQLHMNVSVSRSSSLPVRTTQSIRNIPLGGEIDMSQVCAVNAVATTVVQAAPSQPVAYCGSVVYTLYSYIPVAFTASIAPNGRVRATAVGQYGSFIIYGSGSTTLNGSSFTFTDSTGSTTGTVQNGTVSGTVFSYQLGSGTFSGSTANCY